MPSEEGLGPALLDWFDRVKRPMPWRDTRDPYVHWVSEIMLQQTQVATVLPYFQRWMSAFPSIEALAEADLGEVLAAWSGLGYYRRARLLHEGAKYVVARGVPRTSHEWRAVPGVGEYTAGAIASMTIGEAVAAVDGNVQRVFARLTKCPAVGSALLKQATDWAMRNLDPSRPGDWNEALMELGATVCRPRSPDCASCPLTDACRAAEAGEQALFPVRQASLAKLELEYLVWVPVVESKLGMRQIDSGPWWRGLWEFPRTPCGFRAQEELIRWVGVPRDSRELGLVTTTVTKHRLRLRATLVRTEIPSPHLEWFSSEEALRLPLPSAQRKLVALVSTALRTGTEADSAPDCFL